MSILLNYIKTVGYNINHNKTYALFYGAGTAVTFVFIIIMLQVLHLITHADSPFVNTSRTIHFETFSTKKGDYIGGLPLQDIGLILNNTQGVENWSISDCESVNAWINGKCKPVSANFINAEYFEVNNFDFVQGRGLTKDDVVGRKRFAVVTKYIADKYFQHNALNKKLIIQETEYQIIGVTDNYSSLLNPHENANIWLPHIFNKFVPSCNYYYKIDVLFSHHLQVNAMKENLFHAITQYFHAKNKDVELNKDKMYTIQEEKILLLGGNRFTYGIMSIIILLLIVPAVNIMALNMSNANSRMQEIALRRAIGANKFSSFIQIIIENFVLVCLGLIIALFLIYPVTVCMENVFFNSYSIPVLTVAAIRLPVIIITILLAILYTMLSGAIPAYMIANRNISYILKGDSQ
jgi:ABC-type antimicrobial peptide transport system permease subunit